MADTRGSMATTPGGGKVWERSVFREEPVYTLCMGRNWGNWLYREGSSEYVDGTGLQLRSIRWGRASRAG